MPLAQIYTPPSAAAGGGGARADFNTDVIVVSTMASIVNTIFQAASFSK